MAKKRLPEQQANNGLGIVSIILGVISIVLCWLPILGLAAGIIGIFLAVKQRKLTADGLGTAGLVVSIIGTVFSVIYTIYWIFVVLIIGAAVSVLTGAWFWPVY